MYVTSTYTLHCTVHVSHAVPGRRRHVPYHSEPEPCPNSEHARCHYSQEEHRGHLQSDFRELICLCCSTNTGKRTLPRHNLPLFENGEERVANQHRPRRGEGAASCHDPRPILYTARLYARGLEHASDPSRSHIELSCL